VAAPPPSFAPTPSRQPEEPISRRPTAVTAAPPRPRQAIRPEPPTRRQPGDKICGECGEGNDPVRHFCRRCGSTLDEAAIVRIPWYRRLLNFLFPRRTREAGWRPQRVGGVHPLRTLWRLLRVGLAAVAVVFLLLFALVPSFQANVRHVVNTEYNKYRLAFFPHYDAIDLVAAQASSQGVAHPASMAIDNLSNTYWAARPQDLLPVLHLTFAQPTEVARLLITSGPAGTAPTDQFKVQPRPEQIRLMFSDGQVYSFKLQDEPSPQVFTVNVPQATGVELDVLSEYPALAGSPVLSSVAINEVEFRVKD
jgi:hypothetical protein